MFKVLGYFLLLRVLGLICCTYRRMRRKYQHGVWCNIIVSHQVSGFILCDFFEVSGLSCKVSNNHCMHLCVVRQVSLELSIGLVCVIESVRFGLLHLQQVLGLCLGKVRTYWCDIIVSRQKFLDFMLCDFFEVSGLI